MSAAAFGDPSRFDFSTALAGAIGGIPVPKKLSRSGGVHRTGAPVRRDSREAGTFEEDFFMEPAKGEAGRLLLLAKKAVGIGRQIRRQLRHEGRHATEKEQALVGLTSSHVEVYDELLKFAQNCAGRVYPSYEELAKITNLARATIGRAISALEGAGFLVRQRRFKRVDAEGPGPRYEQTSNAYRAMLPTKILSLLPRWCRPAPPPDDVVQATLDRKEEQDAMIARLSLPERALAIVNHTPLAKALAALGAGVERHGT